MDIYFFLKCYLRQGKTILIGNVIQREEIKLVLHVCLWDMAEYNIKVNLDRAPFILSYEVAMKIYI